MIEILIIVVNYTYDLDQGFQSLGLNHRSQLYTTSYALPKLPQRNWTLSTIAVKIERQTTKTRGQKIISRGDGKASTRGELLEPRTENGKQGL